MQIVGWLQDEAKSSFSLRKVSSLLKYHKEELYNGVLISLKYNVTVVQSAK